VAFARIAVWDVVVSVENTMRSYVRVVGRAIAMGVDRFNLRHPA
jgi:hypothetical protein